ncbi:MAG: hypothetical protein OHK0056_31570 [Bacteriovoracaceae bacterium]
MDGALYSNLAQNAAEGNHWLIPTFNQGALAEFFEHPPFIFMLHGLLMKFFGVSWTTARLLNYLIATILVLAYYINLKKIKDEQFGHLASLILLLTVPFLKKVRFPNMDVALTLFTTLTMMSYFRNALQPSLKGWLKTGVFLA